MGGPRQDLTTRLALEQAQKSAEALFETKSIAEIKKVEAGIRADIQAKKVQVRQLVGESYHDLISSADMILAMANSADAVAGEVARIRGAFARLTHSVSGGGGGGEVGAERDTRATRQQRMSDEQLELYAIGTRVKYLVDTPEAIYGLLDARDALAAAQRVLGARCVHRRLAAAANQRVLSRQFKLLRHEEAASEAKRGEVLACADRLLAGDGDAATVAAAVAARCLLTEGDTAEALAHFLQRRAAAFAALATHLGVDASEVPAEAALRTLAHSVQRTVQLAGDLFMAAHGSSDALVATTATRDGAAAPELMFDPLEVASGGPDGSEVEAWRDMLAMTAARLPPLAAAGVAEAVLPWLDTLAAATEAPMRRVTACAELAAAAAAVQAAVSAWGDEGGHERWGDVAARVLGRHVDVWPQVFEPALLKRANALATQGVEGACTGCSATLAPHLAAAAASATEAPGAASAAAAAWAPPAAPAAPLGVPQTPAAVGFSPFAPAHASPPATDRAAWRAGATEAAAALNSSLRRLLADAAALVPPLHAAERPPAALVDARAQALAESVHGTGAASLQALAARLQEMLRELPPEDTPGTIEQALLIGRVASAIAQDSPALQLAFSLPSAWPQPAPGAVASRTRRRAADSAAREREAAAVAPFSAAVDGALARWAAWAARGLADTHAAALRSEHYLTVTAPPPTWRLCTMATPSGALEADLGAVTFHLPGAPLAATSELMLAAAREVQRAGGALAPQQARHALAESLLEAVAQRMHSAVAAEASAPLVATEQATLQLLFDTIVLSTTLAPPPAAGAAPSAAQAAAAKLEAALAAELDPIDRAAFEPHLRRLASQCVQQRAVALGLLMPAPPVLKMESAAGASAAATTAEAFGAAPACPRLPLLPISMPHVDAALALSLPGRAGAPAAAAAGPASAAAVAASVQARLSAALLGADVTAGGKPADSAAQYSFVTLALAKPLAAHEAAAGATGAADGAGGVAGAAMATLESLGAKFSGSASSALGGVSAVQEQLGSVLAQQGMFSSQLFSSAFGQQR